METNTFFLISTIIDLVSDTIEMLFCAFNWILIHKYRYNLIIWLLLVLWILYSNARLKSRFLNFGVQVFYHYICALSYLPWAYDLCFIRLHSTTSSIPVGYVTVSATGWMCFGYCAILFLNITICLLRLPCSVQRTEEQFMCSCFIFKIGFIAWASP